EKLAALTRRAGDATKQIQILELTQRLSNQFYSLLALQKADALLLEAEKRATNKVALIREGVTRGRFSIGEQKLFEGESFRLQAQRKGTSSSIELLQSEIAAAIGSSCIVIASGKATLDPVPEVTALLETARSSPLTEAS